MRADQEDDFSEFIAAHRDRLRGYAYLLCGDWHRADDIVQQSLIKLYVAWPRLMPGGVHGYVRRVLTNVYLSENRRFWRHREHLSPLQDEFIDQGGSDDDTRMAMQAALNELSPRQRATIILRYWEDLSVADTAITMKCSQGTVKSQTAKALRALRLLLPSLNPHRVKELA